MCGIIIYKGKELKVKTIFDIANKNKHRGEDDGFGYIDLTNNIIKRTILTFDEIDKSDLDSTKRKDTKENTKKALKKQIEELKKEFEKDTSFMLFHHRKASSGGVHIENVHPFTVNRNILYCQNGTLLDYWLLRNYLKIMNNFKFNSTTDTEMAGKIIEMILKKENDLKKAYKLINDILCYYGVIVRIDKKNKHITIFKDAGRSLYVYILEDNGYLFLSEPIFEIKNFKKCYLIEEGIITADEKEFKLIEGKKKDVTKKLKEYLEKGCGEFTCDSAKCDSKNTIRFKGFTCKDYCLHCLLSLDEKDLEGVSKKIKEKDDYINIEERLDDEKWVEKEIISGRTEKLPVGFSNQNIMETHFSNYRTYWID